MPAYLQVVLIKIKFTFLFFYISFSFSVIEIKDKIIKACMEKVTLFILMHHIFILSLVVENNIRKPE